MISWNEWLTQRLEATAGEEYLRKRWSKLPIDDRDNYVPTNRQKKQDKRRKKKDTTPYWMRKCKGRDCGGSA
jgi:hypothetical protein